MAFWPSLSTTIIELDKPQESNYTDTLAKYRQRSYETKFDASSVCTPNSVDPKVGVNDFLWTSGIPEKTWLILSSILPLGASVFLLVATLLERRWTGGLLAYVSENRATAQIISSVIAAILAALNIYTATTLINLAVRIRLLRKTMNLETLKLIGAVTTRQVALGLPLIMYLTSVAMALFCALPSFIWVGALTPIIENTTVVESSILKIPRYIERTSDLWSDNSDRNCPDITNNHGTWSACVARIAQSTLLNRASLASLNTTGGHAKFDNGQYSYIGRSYGVGTPAGIVDENLAQRHGSAELLSYSYTEPGYVSFVECMHNATSDWHLDKIQPGKPGNGIPDIYYALGHFPAAPPDKVDFFSVVSNDEKDLAVMGAKFYAGIHMVLIASAENYSVLNGTQCEILFQPAEFRVVVNTVKKQVSVFPIHGSNSVSNETRFDPTGGLAKTVTNQINLLAMITTSLYTSIVGDALVANIAFATSNSNASTSDPSADALRATADSLSAMVDALLVYVGSSQYFLPNNGEGEFSLIDAELTVEAIRLGDPSFVYITFAISTTLLLAMYAEAFRTRAWASLPLWNFTDMTCLVLSGAVAGSDLLAELHREGDRRSMYWAGHGGSWTRQSLGVDRAGGIEVLPQIRFQLGKKITGLSKAVDENGVVCSNELTAISLQTDFAKDTVPLL